MIRLSTTQLNILFLCFLILTGVFFQSHLLARSGILWCHVDLVTIICIYISMKYELLFSLVYMLFAAMLLHVFSGIAFGFYVMLYLDVLVLVKIINKRLLAWTHVNRWLFFIAIMFLKFLALYFLLYVEKRNPLALDFINIILPEFCISAIMFLPIFFAIDSIYKKFNIATDEI